MSDANDISELERHALGDALLIGGISQDTAAPRAILLTDNWNATAKARAVPESFFDPGRGGWMLPTDCEDTSARIALRLFPLLFTEHPELVARAEVQDVRPIDLSTAAWGAGRPVSADPWQRTLAAARAAKPRPLEPHEYQRKDSQYALDNLAAGGAYLGWEPGLGKTLGACMVADAYDANFILVVCPNSAKLRTWARAAELLPWIEQVFVIGNTKKQRDTAMAGAAAAMDAGTPTMVIAHFEAFGSRKGERTKRNGEVEEVRVPLLDFGPLGVLDLKIIDEAHRMKNPKAGFVQGLGRVHACSTLLLSGSVLDGDVEDLFLPAKTVRPKRYTRRWADWNDRFVDYAEGDFGKISLGARPHRLPELRAELGEWLTIRRASDELDIPAPHIDRVSLPMLPAQRKVYEQLVEELFAELPDGDIVTATAGAALLQKLRVVTGGVPLPGGGVASSKLDYIEELVGGAKGLGVGGRPMQSVVFFWHRDPADQLAARLGEQAVVVHGGVSNKRREERVEQFATGARRVLVATFATLSESVNLQMAGRVVLGEHSWKPLHNDQAIDRVVRQGQKAHAHVVHVTNSDTVDEVRVLPVVFSKEILRKLVIGR